MADEYIRLDTTIIGIDSLINKALTAEEAKVLFTVKDVIYSQQRYAADVQPVKHGRWLPSDSCITAAYGTIHCQICSECGADLMEDSDYDYDFCLFVEQEWTVI